MRSRTLAARFLSCQPFAQRLLVSQSRPLPPCPFTRLSKDLRPDQLFVHFQKSWKVPVPVSALFHDPLVALGEQLPLFRAQDGGAQESIGKLLRVAVGGQPSILSLDPPFPTPRKIVHPHRKPSSHYLQQRNRRTVRPRTAHVHVGGAKPLRHIVPAETPWSQNLSLQSMSPDKLRDSRRTRTLPQQQQAQLRVNLVRQSERLEKYIDAVQRLPRPGADKHAGSRLAHEFLCFGPWAVGREQAFSNTPG